MRCPSCGALYKRRSVKCPECGAITNRDLVGPSQQPEADPTATTSEAVPPKARQRGRAKPTSSLIEFPNLTKSSIPQWRKELGERVREVQERRAREAALEVRGAERQIDETRSKTPPSLEFIPQAEVPPMNPLVVAALRRIERAQVPSHFGNNAVAMAVAYEEQAEFGEAMSLVTDEASTAEIPYSENSTHLERVHNLAVVPTSSVGIEEASEVSRKPRRLIVGDLNDSALNYLDSIPTALHPTIREYRPASVPFRVLSSIVDILAVCLLSSPLAALVLLNNLRWQDPRLMTLGVGTLLVVGFLYFTVSIALTGRTVGMRLFSLRVVDARTGLIPTGGQSAGRAAVYVLSLASAGIALVYMFFNPERQTAHDRFTHTAVIRV